MKQFNFDANSKQIVVNQTEMKGTKGKPQCWSLNKSTLTSKSRAATGSLKLKTCIDGDVKQMFELEDGRIWVDLKMDSGKKYCVTFEGEGKVYVRRCYVGLA